MVSAAKFSTPARNQSGEPSRSLPKLHLTHGASSKNNGSRWSRFPELFPGQCGANHQSDAGWGQNNGQMGQGNKGKVRRNSARAPL